jgi:hypothetical protein
MSDIVECTCGANKDDCIDCMKAEIERLLAVERMYVKQFLDQERVATEQAKEIERLREKSEKDDRLIYAETEKVWLAKKEIERLRAELAAANRCGYGFIR